LCTIGEISPAAKLVAKNDRKWGSTMVSRLKWKGQRKKQDRRIEPLRLYFISTIYENPGGAMAPLPTPMRTTSYITNLLP